MASAKTKKLHTMKETCELTGMAYENLKYYCNTGLVPNVKRSANNRRVFDDHDVAWIKSLTCLKKCGMTIEEMKQYLAYCLQGPASIPVRKVMLEKKLAILEEKKKDTRNPSITSVGNKIFIMMSSLVNGLISATSFRNTMMTTKPVTTLPKINTRRK